VNVVYVPKLEPRIMRYELSTYEWCVISPMFPNKPRGVPRVDDLVSLVPNPFAQEPLGN
jgi:transposase